MKKRCEWVSKEKECIHYHDNEWCKPTHDDITLFEFLILESFQAGLSWRTILKKRKNFKLAFDNFDFEKIAMYNENKFNELIKNTGIIRNKLKINAAINNANIFINIRQEFGTFDKYIWHFANNTSIINNWQRLDEVPSKTPLSELIYKDMKSKGFKFIGSTIIYSYMQAIGMVNDHVISCDFR